MNSFRRARCTPRRRQSCVGESEPELLVLVRCGKEVVGFGVDTAIDTNEHGLHDAGSFRDGSETLDLLEAVDDDRADTDSDRLLELGDTLVVAVHPDPGRVGTCCHGDGEFTTAGDVDSEAGIGDPAHHLCAQERLPGVIDPRRYPVTRRSGRERLTSTQCMSAHLALVQYIERRAVVPGKR